MTARNEWRWTDDAGVQRLVGTDELRAALQNSLLPASTLVWREGMKEWAPAFTLPELASAALAGAGDGRGPNDVMSVSMEATPSGRAPMRTLVGIAAPDGDRPSVPVVPIIVPSAGAPQRSAVITQLPVYGPADGGPVAPAIPPAPRLPSPAVSLAGPPKPRPRTKTIVGTPMMAAPARKQRTSDIDSLWADDAPTNPDGETPTTDPAPPDVDASPAPPVESAAKPSAEPPPTLASLKEEAARRPAATPEPKPAATPIAVAAAASVAPKPDHDELRLAPPAAGDPTTPGWKQGTLKLGTAKMPEGMKSAAASKAPPPPPPRKMPSAPPPPPAKRATPAPPPAAAAPAAETARAARPPKKPPAPPTRKPADLPGIRFDEVEVEPEVSPEPEPAKAPTPPPADAAPKAVEMGGPRPPQTPQPAPTEPALPPKRASERPPPPAASAVEAAPAEKKKSVAPAPPAEAKAPASEKPSSEKPSTEKSVAAAMEEALGMPPRRSSERPPALVPSTPPPEPPTSSAPPSSEAAAARVDSMRAPRSLMPKPLDEPISVPLSSIVAAGGAVVVIGIIAFFVGRSSVGKQPKLEARSALHTMPPFAPKNAAAATSPTKAGPAPNVRCSVTVNPVKWAARASKSIPFELVAASGGTLAVGYARGEKEAVGLTVTPSTGEAKETFAKKVSSAIERVTPTKAAEFRIQTADGAGGMKSIIDVPAKPPFVVGLSGDALVVADKPGGSPTTLWALDGGDELNAARVETAGDAGYGVVFRRANAVWGGWIGAGKKPSGKLAKVAGSGGSVGKPMTGYNGKEFAVIFADRPKGSETWEIRLGHAPAGSVPSTTKVIPLPKGGPGGDAFAPAIAGLADGRWLVVWTEGRAGDRAVRAQTYSPDMKPIGAAAALSPPGGNFGQGVIGVVDNYAAVVFLSKGAKDFELWGAILSCS